MKKRIDLSVETRSMLNRIVQKSRSEKARDRASFLLLYSCGFSFEQLREAFCVSQRTLDNWLKNWSERGLLSLYDIPRQGRKSQLSIAQKLQVRQWAQQCSGNLSHLRERVEEVWSIRISEQTVRRILRTPQPKPVDAIRQLEPLMYLPVARSIFPDMGIEVVRRSGQSPVFYAAVFRVGSSSMLQLCRELWLRRAEFPPHS